MRTYKCLTRGPITGADNQFSWAEVPPRTSLTPSPSANLCDCCVARVCPANVIAIKLGSI